MVAKTLYPWCQAPGLDPGFLSARCKCLEILRRLSPLGRNQYNIGALIIRIGFWAHYMKEATMDYQLFAITPAAFRKLPVLELVLVLVLALVLVLVLV